MALLTQILHCFVSMVVFFIPCILVCMVAKYVLKAKGFVYRKLLHLIAVFSLPWMSYHAETWYAAALTAVLLAVVLYPMLLLCERAKWYAAYFEEKSTHEIRRSMLMLFLMYAALVTVSWGLLQRPDLCAASILMWGIGDAAAALIGIPFGKHKLRLPHMDGKKSVEGSAAMLLCSLAAGCISYLLYGTLTPQSTLLVLLPSALAGAVTELYSPSEWDTVTVPCAVVSAQIVLLLLQGAL